MREVPRALLLASAEPGRWLPGSVAFGTSMLPLLRPGEELWSEPADPASIRPGDIITFQAGPNVLVTHRVLEVLQREGGRAFLTKGDNRLVPDPLVPESRLVGRVIRAGGKDLTRPGWRLAGRAIALLSRAQARAYRALARSRLNRLRYALERRGLFPRASLRPWFRALSSPLDWANSARRTLRGLGDARRRRSLSIREFSQDAVEEMARVWNQAFPGHRTAPERLLSRLCGDPVFDPAGCLLALGPGGLLGWAVANREASIQALALTEAGWRAQAGPVLLKESAAWLRGKGRVDVSLGPQWVPESPLGVPWSPLLDAVSECDFEPAEAWAELSVARDKYRPQAPRPAQAGVSVRPWRAGDDGAVEALLSGNRYRHAWTLYDRYRGRRPAREGVLLGFLEGRLAGFCRWLKDDDTRDCGDPPWIWTLAQPRSARGYFFHLLVDREARGRGLGTLLAARAFQELFDAGCRQVFLAVQREGFYERFGFSRHARFLKFKRAGDV